MKNKNKDTAFFKELMELASMAPDAMKRLRKATGKFGYAGIRPMTEKRWNEKCFNDYEILVGLVGMIQFGKTNQQIDEEIIRQWKTQDDSWIGKVKTGTWKCSTVRK